MQLLLTKYWVLAHLLVLASTLFFIPDTVAKLNVTLWGCFSLWLFTYLLPTVRRTETFTLARIRTFTAIGRDPLFYLGLLLVAFFSATYFNSGRTLIFEEENFRWAYSAPLWSWMPNSINPETGIAGYCMILVTCCFLLCARHGLTRKGRIFLLISFSLLGSLAALIKLLFATVIPVDFYFLASTGFSSGVLHLVLACVALGCAFEYLLEKRPTLFWFSLAGILGNMMGIVQSLNPAVIVAGLVISLAAVVFFAISVSRAVFRPQVGLTLGFVLLLLIAWTLPLALAPNRADYLAVADFSQWGDGLSLWLRDWSFRNGLAWDIGSENRFLGAGFGGYEAFARFHLVKQSAWDIYNTQTLGTCDHVRLISNHGFLGAGLIYATVIYLLALPLMQWANVMQFRVKELHRYVFILIWAFVALLIVLGASFIDLPLHDPALFLVTFVLLGSLPDWLPRI